MDTANKPTDRQQNPKAFWPLTRPPVRFNVNCFPTTAYEVAPPSADEHASYNKPSAGVNRFISVVSIRVLS
jgi:hypothetical protein